MSLWSWLLFASALAYAIKLSGYLVPASVLENPHMTRIAGTLTIGLLASLTAMNAFSAGQTLTFDARVAALAAGGLALFLHVPFLGVVIAGALASAVTRVAMAG